MASCYNEFLSCAALWRAVSHPSAPPPLPGRSRSRLLAMAGVKRAAPGKSEQAERRDRVANFWTSFENDERDEQSADLAIIVQELCRAPQKIKRCKKAVLTDLFDTPTNEADEEFGPTVNYLYKLPKEFLKKTLPQLTSVSADALAKAEKSQKGSMLHLLCRVCQLEVGSPVEKNGRVLGRPSRPHEGSRWRQGGRSLVGREHRLGKSRVVQLAAAHGRGRGRGRACLHKRPNPWCAGIHMGGWASGGVRRNSWSTRVSWRRRDFERYRVGPRMRTPTKSAE